MGDDKTAIRIFSDFSETPTALRSLLLRAGYRRHAISAATGTSPVSGLAARGRLGTAYLQKFELCPQCLDLIDAVGIEGEVILDRRHGGIRLFIAPDSIG
jgi:hypothetical protein